MAAVALADKIVRLHAAFTRARVPHAFGGALALAYYATPRTTVDVDVNVFLPSDRYPSVATMLRRLGADVLPPADVAERDGQVRAWWGDNPIDLFFSYDDIHEAMREATRTVPFGKTTIPILAPEHLIVAKVVFNRSKDWIDLEQMLVSEQNLDMAEIRRWLDHLAGKDDARVRRFTSLARKLYGDA